MSAFRKLPSAVTGAMAPDRTSTSLRLRTSLDMLLTLAMAVLAVVLVIGYQVLGRLGSGGSSGSDRSA